MYCLRHLQYKGTLQLDEFAVHSEPDEYVLTVTADAVGELDKRVSVQHSNSLDTQQDVSCNTTCVAGSMQACSQAGGDGLKRGVSQANCNRLAATAVSWVLQQPGWPPRISSCATCSTADQAAGCVCSGAHSYVVQSLLQCVQELYRGVAESLRQQIIDALQQLLQEMVEL
jgi:hypothetical protein